MWTLVTAWATDINTDPGHGRTMDPDMVVSSSLGQANTMVQSDKAGHLDWQEYHRSNGPWISIWPQVAA